jgi:Icc-related predicted phosphoesterase
MTANGRPKIAAASDIHAPRHLSQFAEALGQADLDNVDLFLLAGDIVHNNQHAFVPQVTALIRVRYSGPIYACFGNNEFESTTVRYRLYGDVKWLDDQLCFVELGATKVGVIGTRGIRDRVTPWLVWGVTPNPDVEGTIKSYGQRETTIRRLLEDAAEADAVIVLSHYAPTYKTLIGEDQSQYAELGTNRFEELMVKYGPQVWVHGHAHLSSNHHVVVGTTRVYNVALPATKKITVFEL